MHFLVFRELFGLDEGILRPDGSDTIAAVFVGDRPRYSYDMVYYPREVSSRDVPFRRLHEACPMLDVMLYPLVHLHGEESFLDALPRSDHDESRSDAYVGTLRQYYAARLMVREGHPAGNGVLFQCRALFQQWLCDAALKIMDSNLRYIESHQEEMTACQYDSLQRFVESEAERAGKRPGRVVILPKSQQMSERRMYSNYLNAVRISMEFGPPTWFLTLTCNPSWEEIKECLRVRSLPADQYMHAADVVVRNYLARCNVLLSDVVHNSVLGQTRAYVGVHEFTTTGLPHFHLAVILNEADSPELPEQIDAFISVEIPRVEDDPRLQKLVLGMMMHRPCDGSSPGYDNPPCRKNGGPCAHGFPKVLSDATVMTPRGPVLRRRRAPAVWHRKFRCYVDNRWCVEYLIKELLRLKGHMNALVCSGIFWKYLFGYMEKSSTGHHVQGTMLSYALREAADSAVLDWDEVAQSRTMRMFGPFEAVFHILGQPITVMSHSVQSLPVHLPGRQIVYYRGDHVRAANLRENSKLLAWFRLNERDESQKEKLYSDVVQDFKYVMLLKY